MLARDNEQQQRPPRMPRRLLGESRELEAAAPPPKDQPYRGRDGGWNPLTLQAWRLSRGPSPPAPPSPEPALRTWSLRSGILLRRRLRRPLPIPSLPGPAPSSAAATGRCFRQSKLRLRSPAANSRRSEAGLLQSHPISSRGTKIPFVWESQAGIELASLPGGSTLLRPVGVWARSLPCQGSATGILRNSARGTPCGVLIGILSTM